MSQTTFCMSGGPAQRSRSCVWALGLSILCLFVFSACDPDISDPSSTSEYGSLYSGDGPPVLVGLGGSLIAGVQDGALYERAAANGMMNLLAQQMGISDFERPIVPGQGVGLPRVFLRGFDAAGNPQLERRSIISSPSNSDLPRAYNVLGVPGALVSDMTFDGDFSASPTLTLPAIARSKTFGNSLVEQAAGLNPDVLVLWTGNNDVLLWASSGGDVNTGVAEPTSAEDFKASYDALMERINQLMPQTQVIIVNIPEITTIPFFSTIPWNVLPLSAEDATLLNQSPIYMQLGISFAAGANGPVFESPGAPGNIKQATAEDKILLTLPTDSLQAGWGTQVPIPDRYVLDAAEVMRSEALIDTYNETIGAAAERYANVTMLNANELFNNINVNGYPMVGSTPLSSNFISGGIFSLDGIHPCSRGYGVVVNELINLINTRFDADLPQVPLPNLPAVYLDVETE